MARMSLVDGGVVRAVLDICQALAKRNHDVTLLTFCDDDVPQQWKSPHAGEPKVVLLNRKGKLWPKLTTESAEIVRKQLIDADALHVHVPWDPICADLGRIAKSMNIPYVVSLHGMLDDCSMRQKNAKKRIYLRVAGKRLLEEAAAVHCTAEAEKDQTCKWYPDGQSVVLPLIFDLEEYESLPGPEIARQTFASVFPDETTPLLLFLSRLHMIKGLELLIDTAEQLRDSGSAFKLIIAGTGEKTYEQQLKQMVNAKELSEHISFLGFVTGIEKVSLYEAADIFVLPTSHENWGFVLIEALACGTPLVTTKGVNIWPELQSSGGAVIADATVVAMAEAITNLLQDDSKLNSMGAKGREWVLENMKVDKILSQYENLYSDI